MIDYKEKYETLVNHLEKAYSDIGIKRIDESPEEKLLAIIDAWKSLREITQIQRKDINTHIKQWRIHFEDEIREQTTQEVIFEYLQNKSIKEFVQFMNENIGWQS